MREPLEGGDGSHLWLHSLSGASAGAHGALAARALGRRADGGFFRGDERLAREGGREGVTGDSGNGTGRVDAVPLPVKNPLRRDQISLISRKRS